jgi:hypothetical protein
MPTDRPICSRGIDCPSCNKLTDEQLRTLQELSDESQQLELELWPVNVEPGED